MEQGRAGKSPGSSAAIAWHPTRLSHSPAPSRGPLDSPAAVPSTHTARPSGALKVAGCPTRTARACCPAQGQRPLQAARAPTPPSVSAPGRHISRTLLDLGVEMRKVFLHVSVCQEPCDVHTLSSQICPANDETSRILSGRPGPEAGFQQAATTPLEKPSEPQGFRCQRRLHLIY